MLALLETMKIGGIVYVLLSYLFIYLLFGLLFAKKVEEREEFEILNLGSSVILFPLPSFPSPLPLFLFFFFFGGSQITS